MDDPVDLKPVTFVWDLHYSCNYRCPYCWFSGKWHDLARQNINLPIDNLLKAWRGVYEKYGSAHIEIIGGEPFIYPNFTELIKQLSSIHTVGITTNLSVEMEDFVKEVDSLKVKIVPTFHPLFADFDKFVKKASLLEEKGMIHMVNYLAYPPQIKFISYYKKKFSGHNIELSVMTFWGKYNGKDYPQSYTPQERQTIEPCLGNREGEKFQLEPKPVKGGICRAGQRYAIIKANGSVFRCGGSHPELLGNLFSGNFSLLDCPSPCKSEFCPCNEWAFLLNEKVNIN